MNEELTPMTIATVRRRLRIPFPVNRTIIVLTSVAMVVAGFIGGLLVEQNWGGGSGGTGGNDFANTFPGGLPSGNPFANSTAPTGTTGTVTKIDGSTIYITTTDGRVVTVKTDGSTAVQSQSAGTVKGLEAGQTITVTGNTGTDGSVTATRITQQP
jgi:hypothetical protein